VRVIVARGPGVTVRLAVPDALPEAAMTIPEPTVAAVKSPEVLIVPIPPIADQVGVMEEMVFPLASLPAALN
jgi:hypothetical protein